MKNQIIALGQIKTTILTTMISVIISFIITVVVLYFTNSPIYKIPLTIAVICPLIICPPLTFIMLKLLFKIHKLERNLASRHDTILAAIPDIIMEVNMSNNYIWANQPGFDFFGKNVIGMDMDHYFAEDQDTCQRLEPVFNGKKEIVYVQSLQNRKDEKKRFLSMCCCAMKNEDGDISSVIYSARDITENKITEESLAQSQKMEAIGRLAGGIAHDFNNQLAGITGFCELIRQEVETDITLTGYAKNILLASQRSTDLIKQLLSFAKKGDQQTISLDIHKIIKETTSILEHTINENISIKLNLKAHNSVISGDPTQLQNAVLNIGINARDAMPQGGKLLFETTIKPLNQEFIQNNCFEIETGIYFEISITDTGTGMDMETKKHIFEPFFTTKDTGKGTGLGLSSVYGIIKNHKGAIDVNSEPGQGTTFKIYLPVLEKKS